MTGIPLAQTGGAIPPEALGFLRAGLPAFVVAAAAMTAAWRPWRRRHRADDGDVPPPAPRGRWGAAVGLGLGAAVGLLWLLGEPPGPDPYLEPDAVRTPGQAVLGFAADEIPPLTPPAESQNWLVWIVGAALVVAVLDAVRDWPWWLRRVPRIALPPVAAWLLLRPVIEHPFEPWSTGATVAWLVGLTAATWLWWEICDLVCERLRGAAPPLALGAAAAGLCGVIALAYSTTLAWSASVFAAGLVACVIVCWWDDRVEIARGGAAVLGLCLPMTAIIGAFLVEQDVWPWPAPLLAAAPLGMFARRLPWLGRLPEWARTAVGLGVCAALAAGAVGVAYGLTPSLDPYLPS